MIDKLKNFNIWRINKIEMQKKVYVNLIVKEIIMKDYIVTHTFKSEELKDQYFEIVSAITEND